ncbi:uncharacterized protein CC84DRAFT_1162003 [Paraphaeosphaeria sporulosa]|uniref:Uncharacterized protein n=1 Tax=Paraphaeosphaeria sporulosa TaxID=1460663 RepID=A0A177CM83_9PLEO|nr:uncharacterized protein CC84DRAFT_1162003 [Paraphaeosphaeria sporulosa]OAG07970.1 hypothetical protein CC84DRAFT_1162003 [Paraphaeosphaeria sporulosa]
MHLLAYLFASLRCHHLPSSVISPGSIETQRHTTTLLAFQGRIRVHGSMSDICSTTEMYARMTEVAPSARNVPVSNDISPLLTLSSSSKRNLKRFQSLCHRNSRVVRE